VAPEYSFDSSAPDQKRSSKCSASRSARSSTRFLRKMISHEAIEANNSSSITNCTGMLACTISCSRSMWPAGCAAAVVAAWSAIATVCAGA
jgi:hypothetical protein